MLAISNPNDHEGLAMTPAGDSQFRSSDASSQFKSHQVATMRRSYHDFQSKTEH